ncbi:MAG TPA: metal ABC transporter ATP-binding protein [Blastocatellia bacterium]
MTNSPQPMLKVKDLSVRFGPREILSHLNFDIWPNETFCIIGPNGAGKSVLLKTLLNLIPYTGEIIWAEGVKIGYVPQKVDLDMRLPVTVADLITAKCAVSGAAKSERDEIVDVLELRKELLGSRVGQLSGGQLQRVLIGLALIGRPKLLLFDEPTANVDLPGEEHIYEVLNRLQKKYQFTLVIVSHDLTIVDRYAQRVLCLNRRGLCIGKPREVLTSGVLEELYGTPMKFHWHEG